MTLPSMQNLFELPKIGEGNAAELDGLVIQVTNGSFSVRMTDGGFTLFLLDKGEEIIPQLVSCTTSFQSVPLAAMQEVRFVKVVAETRHPEAHRLEVFLIHRHGEFITSVVTKTTF